MKNVLNSIFMVGVMLSNICLATPFKDSESNSKGPSIKKLQAKWSGLDAAKAYKIAVVKYKKRSFKEAASYFLVAARNGLAEAQFTLGIMLENGQGLNKNHKQAAQFFRLAAKQGHVKAQYKLGYKYQHGEGVEQNSKKAARILTPPAQFGYPQAQHALGTMYEAGIGVEQSDETAAHLFLLAAQQGYPRAYYALGMMHENGKWFDQCHEMALKFISHAARKGYFRAQDQLRTYNGRYSAADHAEQQIFREDLEELEGTFVGELNL